MSWSISDWILFHLMEVWPQSYLLSDERCTSYNFHNHVKYIFNVTLFSIVNFFLSFLSNNLKFENRILNIIHCFLDFCTWKKLLFYELKKKKVENPTFSRFLDNFQNILILEYLKLFKNFENFSIESWNLEGVKNLMNVR